MVWRLIPYDTQDIVYMKPVWGGDDEDIPCNGNFHNREVTKDHASSLEGELHNMHYKNWKLGEV